MYKSCLLFLLAFALPCIATAQLQIDQKSVARCSADEIHQKALQSDEAYQQWYQSQRKAVKRIRQQSLQQTYFACATPTIIPVAVHYEGVTTQSAACLEALALDQIRILNEDFSASNTDISNYCTDVNNSGGTLEELAVAHDGSCIQFCLADQNHPNGFGLNNGDYAITTGQDYVATNSFPNFTLGVWSGYLNIFVTEGTGVLGYAPAPGDAGGDGVVIEACVFGSTGAGCGNGIGVGGNCDASFSVYNQGRTTTHEVGHYLSLNHMWGNNNAQGNPIGCTSDDNITDTPNSDTQNFGCPTIGASTTKCGSQDMYMNFMDYTDDACMYMFSELQATNMFNTANSLNFASDKCNMTPTYPASALPGGCGVSSVSLTANQGTSSAEGTDCDSRLITFDVVLSKEPSAATTVSWSASGTASSTDDYTLQGAGSYTFSVANWSNPHTVTISIEQDAVIEPDETIIVDITSVSGSDAVESSNGQITFTLTNDDIEPSATGGGTGLTIFSEDFSGANNWTQSTTAGSRNLWRVGTNAGLNGNAAYISRNNNAYSYSNTESAARYESISIDASAYTNLELSFDYICNGEINQGTYYDYGSLWYTVDGNTWNSFGNELQGQANSTNMTLDLPSTTDNAATLQLGFRWDNDTDTRRQPPFAFDNVILKGDQALATVIQSDNNSVSGFAEHDLGPNQTVNFYDQATGNIMCTIVNGSHDFGCTKVEVVSSGTATMTSGNTSVVEDLTSKSFLVTPEFNNSSASYTITLYYTAAEINGFTTSNSNSGDINTEVQLISKGPGNLSSTAPTEVVFATPVAFGSDFTISGSFSTGFSGFAAGDGAAALPVELVAFNAIPKTNSIILDWSTASETNNEGFEIQRSSTHDSGFETIAWVKSKGNSNSVLEYTHTDHKVVVGNKYYYRLMQKDLDGKLNYSLIKEVEIKAIKSEILISPNPADSYIRISSNSTPTVLSIFNSKGQLIIKETVKDSNIIRVNDLENGFYVVKLQEGGNITIRKLMIQR